MRLVNWTIHSLIVAFLFCLGLHAQTQGNLPQPIDSYTSQGNIGCTVPALNCVKVPEDIAVNDLIVIAVLQDVASGAPPWTVSDTLGNTYTALTAVTSTVGPSNDVAVQLFYTLSAFAGADQITSSNTCPNGCALNYQRFAHITGTVDGAVVNTVGTSGTGINPISTSKTITTNGDLLVSAVGGTINAGAVLESPSSNLQYLVQSGVTPTLLTGFRNTGVTGAYTSTANCFAGNSSQQCVMSTIAFTPSGIGIVDTALPNCSSGQPYSAQLHAVGGAGAYTFSATAGAPGWLSVSSAGVLSGTCATGTSTVTFQVTDGTHTSTTNLTLQGYAGSYLTPTVVQSTDFSFNNGGAAFTMNGVNCGDMIFLFARGVDTHGTTGYVQTVSGANNRIFDSQGNTITRLPAIAGQFQSPLVVYAIGPLKTGGSDTITGQNSTSASGALPTYSRAVEVTGIQSVVDIPTFSNQVTTVDTAIATSYVTPVANEIVLAGSGSDQNFTTFSFAAPFSLLDTNIYPFASAAIVAASTATSTVTPTTSCGDSPRLCEVYQTLVGLRPAPNGSTCTSGLTEIGEKYRRQIY